MFIFGRRAVPLVAVSFPPGFNPAGAALKPGRFQGGIFTQEHGQSHA
jgi:hypothetical protein